MAFLFRDRDTDADWREIGKSRPFWGVLTQDRFQPDNINQQALELFYRSGVSFIEDVAATFEGMTGAPFRARTALDFGCGTGRLTEAMASYAEQVTGYDVSPGMLAKAGARGAPRVSYTGELPANSFDWINSFIVFQHIPPARGMAILEQLLGRLAAGGFISLHFTLYNDFNNLPLKPSAWRRFRRRLRPLRRWIAPPRTGAMFMYEYDLNRLCRAFHEAGIDRLCLVHVNHDGHHGVKIFGRRETSNVDAV